MVGALPKELTGKQQAKPLSVVFSGEDTFEWEKGYWHSRTRENMCVPQIKAIIEVKGEHSYS